MMLRTQIYLPEQLHDELTSWAIKMKVPMAQIVRQILQAGLEKREAFLPGENDLLELTKLKIKGGPTDLSLKLDSYLYQ